MARPLASVSPTAEPFTGDRFQILSLDGGGAKALFSANVLDRFEQDHQVRIVDHFDLIAGTSAGGIIALALGAGLSPAEVSQRYRELIARVFPKRRQSRWRPNRLLRPAYSSKALREALQEVFGEMILGQSQKRLLVPSWDVQSGQVHLFKTPHHPRLVRDWRISMVDVALATSAAPTYFSAASVDSGRLIDGGVFANNPSVFAIGEAKSMLGVPLGVMRVLSVGTTADFNDHSDRLDKAGVGRWATAAVSTILSASSSSSNGLAGHLVGLDNFVRVDATVPSKVFALDSIDEKKLAGYAASVSREKSPELVEKFLDHAASVYVPVLGRNGDDAGRKSRGES